MSQSPTIIQRAIYKPERVIEARVVTVGTNKVDLIALPTISPDAVELNGINAARNAAVAIYIEGTSFGRHHANNYESNRSLSLEDYHPYEVLFDTELRVRTLGTGAVANYQMGAIYTIKTLSVADKISMGVTDAGLDDEELRLKGKYYLDRFIAAGLLPYPRHPETGLRQPEGKLLYTMVGDFAGNLAANAEQTILEVACKPGQKVVLRKIWADRPAVATTLALRITRDREQTYFDIQAFCLPDFATVAYPTRELDLYVPSPYRMKLSFVASGAGDAGVRASCIMEVRKMTIWDKLAWGLIGDARITLPWEKALATELMLDEKRRAGIYDLMVTLPIGE